MRNEARWGWEVGGVKVVYMFASPASPPRCLLERLSSGRLLAVRSHFGLASFVGGLAGFRFQGGWREHGRRPTKLELATLPA